MRPRPALSLLLLACALFAAPAARAAEPVAEAAPEITIVVVDSLQGNSSELNNFDRIARVFTEVLRDRKWPYTIKAEQFAANSRPHAIELRIFFQGMREETAGDMTFRAWMVLYDHGTEHDFGVIRFRYDTRPMEQTSDRLDRSVRGAARIAASKMEGVLFPKEERRRP